MSKKERFGTLGVKSYFYLVIFSHLIAIDPLNGAYSEDAVRDTVSLMP